VGHCCGFTNIAGFTDGLTYFSILVSNVAILLF